MPQIDGALTENVIKTCHLVCFIDMVQPDCYVLVLKNESIIMVKSAINEKQEHLLSIH